MENAADALKIAASVLIFVVALSISINAFGEARMTATTILNYQDNEYDYTYVEENTDASGNVSTERIVGVETVVPSIYKAYRENYKIVFKGLDGGVYTKDDETGRAQEINTIDLQNEVLGTESQKEQFVNAILYGRKYSEFNTVKTTFENNLRIHLNDEGIYDKIGGRKIKENIGIYYQEEAGLVEDEEDSSVPDANKTTKRVITYTLL